MQSNLLDSRLTLEPDEEFIIQARRSLTILIVPLLIGGLFIFVPFFFLFFLFQSGELGIVTFFSSILLGAAISLNAFVSWKYTGFVITDQRVIDYDQGSLFKRTVSNIPMRTIQEVFYEIKGIKQIITKTGTITILVSDSQTKFRLSDVARPDRLHRAILQLSKDLNFRRKNFS